MWHAPSSSYYYVEWQGPGRADQWEKDKVTHWSDQVLARVRHIRAASVAVEQSMHA